MKSLGKEEESGLKLLRDEEEYKASDEDDNSWRKRDDGGRGGKTTRTTKRVKFANKQKFSEDEEEEEEEERGELEEQPFVIIKSTRDPTKRKEDAYDKLFANGAFDKKRLLRFFRRRPVRVAGRMTRIITVFRRLSRQWKSQDDWPMEKRTRAKLLREARSTLLKMKMMLLRG